VTPHYLLDTNVVSESLRPRPNAGLLARLEQFQGEFAIASPVWHELWYGCYRMPASAKRAKLEAYLNEIILVTMPILPYDENAAAWHAAERARLVAVGKTPAYIDGQIAAVAVTNNLALVTFNAVDYRGFAGLLLTDWAG
jgi:tRNA(fMet)-specific endonuclease VapC